MNTINEVHILGRAARDGEIKHTSGGKTLGKFCICTDGGKKKDGSGDWPTNFHQCQSWGDALGEAVAKIRKGAIVEIVGRISYGSYEKDGVKKYTTDIVASKISFPEGEEREYQVDRGAAPRQAAARPVTEADPIDDLDIPF